MAIVTMDPYTTPGVFIAPRNACSPVKPKGRGGHSSLSKQCLDPKFEAVEILKTPIKSISEIVPTTPWIPIMYNVWEAIGEGKWEDAVAILGADPKKAQYADDDGYLPLHLAFIGEAPDDVILAISRMYPPALFVENCYGSRPFDLMTGKFGLPFRGELCSGKKGILDGAEYPVAKRRRE
jgi:hypothetical protein